MRHWKVTGNPSCLPYPSASDLTEGEGGVTVLLNRAFEVSQWSSENRVMSWRSVVPSHCPHPPTVIRLESTQCLLRYPWDSELYLCVHHLYVSRCITGFFYCSEPPECSKVHVSPSRSNLCLSRFQCVCWPSWSMHNWFLLNDNSVIVYLVAFWQWHELFFHKPTKG